MGSGGIEGGHPKKSGFKGGGGGGALEKFSQSCGKLSWIGGGSPQIVFMKMRGGGGACEFLLASYKIPPVSPPPTPLKMNSPLEGNLSKKN